jgi:glycosyltransferase involved in cell wall biosynthesis
VSSGSSASWSTSSWLWEGIGASSCMAFGAPGRRSQASFPVSSLVACLVAVGAGVGNRSTPVGLKDSPVMDIGVCLAQVPFTEGGMERWATQLCAAFSRAGHRAEQVRLPAAWHREAVFDAAAAWRLLPIGYDVVVCLNFPAYYVRHPRKVLWLGHQHRSAYDAFDAPWSDFGVGEFPSDAALDDAQQLAAWDAQAIGESSRRFTISARVADRLNEFHGIGATPLYHPSPLADRLRPSPIGDSIVCVTRLEANKRPDLVVEAAALTSSRVPVILVGGGSMEAALRARAAELNAPVRFTGRVDDADVLAAYHSALAIAYVPHDEDYGYGTLEGFGAGKAVITASDGGGTREWVDDGVNGLVVEPTPQAVADAFDRLAGDRSLAVRLGVTGAERVAGLDWSTVVNELLA